MTLPASGIIKLSDIATEFGDPAPYTLRDFLGKGGAPASGVLKMSDFYGRSAFAITGTSPTLLSGYGSGMGSEQVTSDSTTVTASGSGLSYLWEIVSGVGFGVSATNPTLPTTSFTKFMTKDEFKETVWRCKVTNDSSQVLYSANVTVQLTNGVGA